MEWGSGKSRLADGRGVQTDERWGASDGAVFPFSPVRNQHFLDLDCCVAMASNIPTWQKILICYCSRLADEKHIKGVLKTEANHLHNHFNDKYAILIQFVEAKKRTFLGLCGCVPRAGPTNNWIKETLCNCVPVCHPPPFVMAIIHAMPGTIY